MKVNGPFVSGFSVVLLWASAFPAIRVAAPTMGAIGLSFARLFVASMVLLALATIKSVRFPQTRDFAWILAAGFFGMTAYQLLLNTGELHVPAGTASVIIAAAPVVSTSLAWILFQERVSIPIVVGSVIALAGVSFVCLVRSGAGFSSSAWIVVAAMVVQGVYHPLQRPLLRRYSSVEVACYTVTSGMVMTIPFVPFGMRNLLHADIGAWLAAIYLGVFPSAAGFVLWAYASARTPVAVSTSLLYLVPPVAVLIAWIWLGESPTISELLGGGIVIVGVAIISRFKRPAARRTASGSGSAPAGGING